MSVSTIADAMVRKNEQNPQFDYLWRVELPSLRQAPISPASALNNGLRSTSNGIQAGLSSTNGILQTANSFFEGATNLALGDEMLDLNHRVYAADVPFYSFDTEKSGGVNYFYSAGHKELGTITLIIDEYEDGKTLEYIDHWMHMIKNDNGTVNPPAYYKRDIKYVKMSSGKFDLHVSTYKGFFPSQIQPLSSNYDSNGIVQYNVTFTGDRVKHVIIPESIVKARIAQSDYDILSNNIQHSKFSIGDIDGNIKSRAFNRVLDLFNL